MSDETQGIEPIDDISDALVLESKIREKVYELQLKRKLAEDSRIALTKLDAEKHEQIQRAENAERELSEIKIHLEVAIKAAREAEAERSSGRELLSRQKAQLEATSKEREIFQQLNRSQQLELCELRRELEDSKAKMKSQSCTMEVIQKKDSKLRATLDTLICEVAKLENSQIKLKEICNKICSISKVIITALNQHKTELSLLRNEKSKLQDEVISLTVKLDSLVNENSKKEQINCEHIFEWESAQKEMLSRIEDSNNVIDHLQSSLDSALAAVAKYQIIEIQNSEKIKALEEKLEKEISALTENKFTQTENLKEVFCNTLLSTVSNHEIQSSEVDTCEGK